VLAQLGLQDKAAPQGPSQVFLTGASGFLGAFIIRDLLAEGHTVSCLVRADDKRAAMGRLQQNMKDYGIWSPDYAASLKVYCGDLESKNFGLKADEWPRARTACSSTTART
jgi:thioester reductase-like protein